MNAEIESYWRAQVAKFERYRGSEAAFVVEHGLHLENFRRWQNRLAAQPAPKTPLFVELTPDAMAPTEPPLPPPRVTAPPIAQPKAEIEFPNGIKLRCDASLEAATLAQWARALGGLS